MCNAANARYDMFVSFFVQLASGEAKHAVAASKSQRFGALYAAQLCKGNGAERE